MIQALRQIIDAQLRVVQRMSMCRRGSRRRLMRVRHRRPRHGIIHVDPAVVTAMPGDAAACPGASGVVVVMKMLLLLLRLLLLRLRLLLLLRILVQRAVVQMMMVVPAVQRARARLIIIVMMPGAR